MTDRGNSITEDCATSLVKRIASGELSSRDVVSAHIERIEQVNPRLNAVVVPLFEQAMLQAAQADELQARGKTMGLLHGLPITIKEMFDVVGTATTAGITTRAKHRADTDAPVVAALRDAGAVFLGKTNVPMMGLKAASDNPLYGTTNNPWDESRSPGGSSGGEAAIISAGGSPLGLGSDGGGSIRQPSHSCGIAGIKPTGWRFPMQGHWTVPNWSIEWAQPGPIARDVDDLRLTLEVLHHTSLAGGIEGNGTPMGDYRQVEIEKLRVGFYTHLGWMKPCNAVQRAVRAAVNHLSDDGAKVEPFDPPDVEEPWRAFLGMFYADGFHFIKQQIKGAQTERDIRQLIMFTRVPNPLRPLLAAFFKWSGQRGMSDVMRMVRRRVISARDYLALKELQNTYRKRFAIALDDAGIDVLVGPPNPMPALRHNMFHANYSLMYTTIYNSLGFPAGVVPATRVREDEQTTSRGKMDPLERCFSRCEENSAGLPIGVQVISRWWREDLVLAVMKRLQNHFQLAMDYPTKPPELS